jgi:hypothetical protein
MTTTNLSGFISFSLNLRFFRNFVNFKLLLKGSLIEKFLPCRLTVVVNMRNSILFLIRLASLTLFRVLMLINRMELLKESIDISLRLACLSLRKRKQMPLKNVAARNVSSQYLSGICACARKDMPTSLERLFYIKPNYFSLRIFGCVCWPHLLPFNSRKLEFRSKQCVLLEYSNIHKCFKCLDLSTGRIYISRDVIFDKNILPFSKLQSNAGPRL